MQAVAQEVPQACDDLYAILPKFRQDRARWPIYRWAIRYHLKAEWCCENAGESLRWWSLLAGKPASLTFYDHGAGGPIVTPPAPLLEYRWWPEQPKTRQDYIELVIEQVKLELRRYPYLKPATADYIEGLRKLADAYWSEVERVRADAFNIPSNENPRHAKWAAQFQVGEFTYSKIAAANNVSVEAVRKAVTEYLTRLPLRPRVSPRGRPKTSQAINSK